MPLGIERHNRILGYRLAAAGTARREQLLEVDAAVGPAVPLIERGAHQWLLAWTGAHEALLVPRLLHGLDGALSTSDKRIFTIIISKSANLQSKLDYICMYIDINISLIHTIHNMHNHSQSIAHAQPPLEWP